MKNFPSNYLKRNFIKSQRLINFGMNVSFDNYIKRKVGGWWWYYCCGPYINNLTSPYIGNQIWN